MDPRDWLRSLGLEEHEVTFRENQINEKVLPSLTAEDLSANERSSGRTRSLPSMPPHQP
jgi:SAM domain (Sterile alpha motif)